MNVLILFGNENDKEGNLSPIAQSRCDLAISILHAKPDMKALPTGAFGAYFNTSDQAHGQILTDYLVKQGISPDRILPFTNTAGTIEDIMSARKVLVDHEAESVTLVTSDFHMPRVEFIARRVLTGFNLTFEESASPVSPAEIEKRRTNEERGLKKTKDEWVDIPLYSNKGQEFPIHTFENAEREQKHYDSVSLAIVTGSVVVFAFLFSTLAGLDQTTMLLWERFVYPAVAVIPMLVLLVMYERTAQAARTGRRILKALELSYDRQGFSASYYRQGFLSDRMGWISLRRAILLLKFLMIILLILIGAFGSPSL
jgi:hypothetical protein